MPNSNIKSDPKSVKLEDIGSSTISPATEPTLVKIVGEYAIIIAESGVYTYIGKATIGSLTSASVWQIKRLDETSGLVMKWSDGNANFDNKWDDYLTLSYS